MKTLSILTALAIVSLSALSVKAELPTYPHSIWNDEPALRKAIAETYPGLITRSYLYNNHSIHGILADEKNQRVLLLLYFNPVGTLIVEHNGAQLVPKELSQALIKTVDQSGDNKFLRIGLWIPMKKTDTLNITGKVTWSAKFDFTIKYDPDRDWRSSISEIKIDEAKLKKADAYHFTEESLLDDVRAVLKKQPTCRVKLKHNQILTITSWKLDRDAILAPMFVKVSDKISINTDEAEEFMKNSFDLGNRLEGYVAVAMAGAQIPIVLLRVTPNANDKLFKDTLNAIRKLRISHIELKEIPLVNPLKK